MRGMDPTAAPGKEAAGGAQPCEATRWLDDAQQQAWRSYLRGTSLVMEALDRELHAYSTTLSEYEILAIVSEAPGARLRMAVLADIAVQSRSRLTHTAIRLEKRGWVARRPVSDDGRGVELLLTAEGRAMLQALSVAHVESVRRILVDPLGEKDFLALGDAMRRVREVLEEE